MGDYERSGKDVSKLIFEVVSLCFSVLALVFVLALAIMALFFPRPYAVVLKAVGLNNMSLGVYESIYNSTSNLQDGYTYITSAVELKKYDKIVSAFEKITQDENFADFMQYIDEQNNNNYGVSFELLGLLNEKDYLSGKYVNALLNLKEEEKAYNFVLDNFDSVFTQKNNLEADKSFLIFDYIHFVSDSTDNKISILIQQNMQEFATTCASFATNFIDCGSFVVADYSKSLECAVRCVEVYKSFKIILKNGWDCILTSNEIDAGLTQGNMLVSEILSKSK